MLAALAYGSIGTDIALKTLSLTCSKAIDGIGYLATTASVPGFTEWDFYVKKTDIEVRIRNVGLLTEVLKTKEANGHQFDPLIKTCLGDINETIGNLATIIDKIKVMKEYQATIYFSTWRFRLPSCYEEVAQLQAYSEILTTRINELEKFSTIVSNLA
jgi:hypothetical protein